GAARAARLATRRGDQRWAESVVRLVRAGWEELAALGQDARPAAVLGQPRREVERRRTAGVVGEQSRQPALKRAVTSSGGVGFLQLDERRHQRLGHEAPAETAEVALRVGQAPHRTAFASAMKRRTLSGSFLPGRA